MALRDHGEQSVVAAPGLELRGQLSRDLPGAPSAESVGLALARAHGVQGGDADALAKLRALPAEQVSSGLNVMTALMSERGTFAGPVEDGRIVVEAARGGLSSRPLRPHSRHGRRERRRPQLPDRAGPSARDRR